MTIGLVLRDKRGKIIFHGNPGGLSTDVLERLQQSLMAVSAFALENNDRNVDGSVIQWASASIRVCMRRHDIYNGFIPPLYPRHDAALLLECFSKHPLAKEIGYGREETEPGTT